MDGFMGTIVGSDVGRLVGTGDGEFFGAVVGPGVGRLVGTGDGELVGTDVSPSVGRLVGTDTGGFVGTGVSLGVEIGVGSCAVTRDDVGGLVVGTGSVGVWRDSEIELVRSMLILGMMLAGTGERMMLAGTGGASVGPLNAGVGNSVGFFDDGGGLTGALEVGDAVDGGIVGDFVGFVVVGWDVVGVTVGLLPPPMSFSGSTMTRKDAFATATKLFPVSSERCSCTVEIARKEGIRKPNGKVYAAQQTNPKCLVGNVAAQVWGLECHGKILQRWLLRTSQVQSEVVGIFHINAIE